MALTVTIAGVDRTASVDAVISVTRQVNAVGRIEFRAVDDESAWSPAQFDAVSIALTGHPTRVGRIAVPPEVGYLLTMSGPSTIGFGMVSQVTAHDNCALATYVLRNGIDVGPITLEAMLQALVTDNLSAHGVTLAAGQVTGPTFETLTWPWLSAFDILNMLAAAAAAATGTSWIWRIDDALVLEMWEAGTKTAPATLTDADILEVIPSTDAPAFRNDQWLVYGPSELRDVTETFTGDGSTRTFPARYRVTVRPAQVYDVTAAAYRNVGVYGVDTLFEWTWDAALGDYGGLRQLTEAPPGTPHSALAVGAQIQATYQSQFPNVVHVWDDGSVDDIGPIVRKDADASIVDVDLAIAKATSILQASTAQPRRHAVRTHLDGCDPGEALTISSAVPGLSGTHLIERVVTSYLVRAGDDPLVEHVLEIVTGSVRPDSSEDWMRGVLAGGSSVGGSAASVSVATGGGTTTIVQGAAPQNYMGGSEVNRTRVASAGTWYRGKDAVDIILDSTKVPATVTVNLHVIAPGGGVTVTPRVVSGSGAAGYDGSGNWNNRAQAGLGSATSATAFEWQAIPVTVRSGVWAYRIELTSSWSNADVGFLGAALTW